MILCYEKIFITIFDALFPEDINIINTLYYYYYIFLIY